MSIKIVFNLRTVIDLINLRLIHLLLLDTSFIEKNSFQNKIAEFVVQHLKQQPSLNLITTQNDFDHLILDAIVRVIQYFLQYER